MEFLDLPDDILLQIWDIISPMDFDAILLTCSRAYKIGVAGRLSRHRQLKAQYTKCTVDSGQRHPAALLHAVWLNPSLAQYVKALYCLQLEDSEDTPDDICAISDTLGRFYKCSSELLADSDRVSGRPWLSANDRKRLYHGDQTSAFCLLLSLLPNLSQLVLDYSYVKYIRPYDIFSNGFLADTASNQTSHALSQLKSVALVGGASLVGGANVVYPYSFESTAVWR